MLFIYRFIINIIIFFLPIIVLFRIIKKKEDTKSFIQKIGIYSKKKKNDLVWFHGSSVGEILSIIPLIEELEKNKKIKQILLTSNTLSSSKVISKLKLNKTIHQFFPIDSGLIVKKFLKYWNPKIAIFVESEIWPNMILEIKKQRLPLVLLNARITKKSFNRWKKIEKFSKLLFNKFDLCLVQNNETKAFLKNLGSKNIKKIGNLKICETKNNLDNQLNLSQKKFFKSKKILLCGVSTHIPEEQFCAEVYENLRKNNKEILILIPRHIHRAEQITKELELKNLIVHKHSSKSKINKNTQVYLVDTYGEAKKFINISNIVFQGGSLIQHGGQNPLEAVRAGCCVLHGPHVKNFTEIYKFLSKQNISFKVKKNKEAIKIISSYLKKKSNTKKIKLKIKNIGSKILYDNKKEILNYI